MSSRLLQNTVHTRVQNMMHSQNETQGGCALCSASSKMMQLQTGTSGCEGDAPQGKSELVWKAGDDKDSLSCTEQGFEPTTILFFFFNAFPICKA